MHIDTLDRRAFEQVSSALERIERFRESWDYSLLEAADRELATALALDPNYLNAVYYLGVVKDLIGRAADAPPFFERIVNGTTDPNIKIEGLYNLGVAYYHQYHKKELSEAKRCFQSVIDSASEDGLWHLARANLAQAYAMSMHPNSEQRARFKDSTLRESVKAEIRTEFEGAVSNGDATLKQLDNKTRRIADELRRRVEGTAHNALGMAHMYYIDRLTEDASEVRDHLEKSLQHLTSADRDLPNDWANTCDLASVHLRRFAKRSSRSPETDFSRAYELLKCVVETLRPGYSFAHYELGRLLRCAGRFDEAIREFQTALGVDARYRDLSDSTVQEEIDRARRADSSFPGSD